VQKKRAKAAAARVGLPQELSLDDPEKEFLREILRIFR
jgi:hypothetical protein